MQIRLFLVPLAVLVFAVAPLLAETAPEREVLFQVSTIDALMAGLFDGTARVDLLKAHGNLGLGTFDTLDGEMLVLDGVVYQVTSDGAAHVAGDDWKTPFAAVTFFDVDQTITLDKETDSAGLQALLDAQLPSKNLFYAFRIDGTFKYVKTRSVPKQVKPYPLLVEVTAKQPTFEMTDVKGTIVGFRCPYYVQGVNVPGYHLHFITADRARGGHLLDCRITSATIQVDSTPAFYLDLPDSEAFLKSNLQLQNKDDLHKVEQDKK